MEKRRMDAALLVLILGHLAIALEVPLDLPQPPTITHQSPKDYIIDPRENITIHCEAKGKPHPSFSWTKDGTHFRIEEDPRVTMKPHSGTLVVDISMMRAENYEGVFQCTARNNHGTAVSNNIVIRQSRSPLWSKEKNRPIVVQEGVSLVLPCRPPAGLPPPIVFWMDNNFQKLPQSRRVSQSLNGDLYFSNVRREDSRNDYICYARFTHTQTIQQKQPITVRVLNLDSINDTMAAFYNDTDLFSEAPMDERKPTFLIPPGSSSSMRVLRGHVLEMECIAEGLPTPEVSWSKVSGELPSRRTSFLHFNKTLRITKVSESDDGVYRCTARNQFGSVDHTISVSVKAAPYWISGPPKNLVLAPGENGVLTCRASGIPKPLITWTMNGIPIENSPTDESRKVEDDVIIFTDVQTGSSAVYQCNVSNEYGYLLSNAFVNVLSEPPRVMTPSNKIYQVIKNHPALLDCASFGSPLPKITWFRDLSASTLNGDNYIFHDNGTIEIPVAQAQNSGKYMCVATNALGISKNHVHLEVKEPTRIQKQREKTKTVQKGRSVVFECKVNHDETLFPTMTWLKDNGELPDEERFVVGSDSLTIVDVTESDAGMYTCIMNTTLDHDSATTELNVVEKPDPPTDLELTDQTKRSVQLTWTPGDEHNSPIQKFLIQYEDSLHHRGHWHNLTEVPGTMTTAHLKLSPYVHYTFRVFALNAVGYSNASSPSKMYKTDPAAPDENPAGVHGIGTEHDNLVISWKPLSNLQSNGPGLHYKVSWRQKKLGAEWATQNVSSNSKFTVSGTPTFSPYEIKVQAVNNYGAGPEPAVVLGFSGEDLPIGTPDNVKAVVINSTLAKILWDAVPHNSIRGHLKGYKVYYWRKHGMHKHNPDHMEKDILSFSGNHTHGMLPGLHPFSAYLFHVRVYNGKGEGPPSPTQHFKTPEGAPGPPTSLEVAKTDLDSLTLNWSPPLEHNGHITGYTLKYQPVNNSNELGPEEELALAANETSVTLPILKYSKRYKFLLSAKTSSGAGPAVSQEAAVSDEAVASRQVDIATQGWFIGLMCAIALLILILLIICFIQRNKGGKYPVKEKEDAHTDPEFQPMKDDDCTFVEYSDNEDHKPLKGSRTPSNGTVKRDDSDDSLVDYGEGGDGQFNEDGSFIGQYSGKSSCRDNAEGPESSEAPSPINAMNSLNSFV
ncbi:neuronal cell adhesion molecule-like isoform X13 [Kryptolebias marmoratus]|uniref:neuronal cell adhesion molecule-like isoform X13 n=1 Tax=Kryptolebias marmoratus TaxID=37003 RepID=UPI0007F89F5D|nr:neuronal cell adhesion molecule-like isoform X13 [Kryptolebias marmoratus]